MKTRIMTWIIAFALVGVSAGQESDEQRQINERFDRAVAQTIAAYPDFNKPNSLLFKKVAVLDNALKLAGDPLYQSPEKPMILADRAAKELGIAARTPANQISDEERQFDERFYRDLAQARAAYPDLNNPDSPLFKKVSETDNALKLAGDPLFNSADKTLILAERAAKELGIAAKVPATVPPAVNIKPGSDRLRTGMNEFADEVIPEFHSFKSVRIRKILPDGLNIIHETGPAKILIEQLSEQERLKYGLTLEAAADYRKKLAVATVAYNERQRLVQQAKNVEKAEKAAELEAEQLRKAELLYDPPVWERYVTNTVAKQHNQQNVADEIRRTDGEAAAAQFLMQQRLTREEEARRNAANEVAQPTRRLTPSTYSMQGDRITIAGDSSRGYRIQGDKLFDVSTGSISHFKSGDSWIPYDDRHHPRLRGQ